MKIRSLTLYYMLLLFIMAAVITAAGSVVANEMELNPPDGGTNWVELYNSGNDSVDISNWSATIADGGWVGKMTVPMGTIIPSKGFYVLNGNSQWNHNNGGFVILYSELGAIIDKFETLV